MSAEITELYNRLFTGKKVSVSVADKAAFESLRVALHVAHRVPRYLLEITNESLCASYDATQGIAIFYLGAPRRSRTRATFVIISEDDLDAQV